MWSIFQVVRKQRPPLQEFIRKVLYKDLNRANTEKVSVYSPNAYIYTCVLLVQYIYITDCNIHSYKLPTNSFVVTYHSWSLVCNDWLYANTCYYEIYFAPQIEGSEYLWLARIFIPIQQEFTMHQQQNCFDSLCMTPFCINFNSKCLEANINLGMHAPTRLWQC